METLQRDQRGNKNRQDRFFCRQRDQLAQWISGWLSVVLGSGHGNPRSGGRVAAQPDENTFQRVEVAEVHENLTTTAASELDLDRCGQQVR